jgi:guanylate kinase
LAPSSVKRCSKRLRAEPKITAPHIFVLIGPGGAGKGTVAAALIAQDPHLWLSRSWTTRKPRPGERERSAYVFVDRPTFEAAVAAGGFYEWAEFLDYLMGTPIPDPPPGSDVLLEIDVQGAEQVLAHRPDATVIMLLPPSPAVQAERLKARGDDAEHIRRRVELGRSEVERGAKIAAHTVINDDLGRALAELTAIVDRTRSAAPCAANPEES